MQLISSKFDDIDITHEKKIILNRNSWFSIWELDRSRHTYYQFEFFFKNGCTPFLKNL